MLTLFDYNIFEKVGNKMSLWSCFASIVNFKNNIIFMLIFLIFLF